MRKVLALVLFVGMLWGYGSAFHQLKRHGCGHDGEAGWHHGGGWSRHDHQGDTQHP